MPREAHRSLTAAAVHRKRIIPCLDVRDGRVVKGGDFVAIRDAGDPVGLAARHAEQVFIPFTLAAAKPYPAPRGIPMQPTKPEDAVAAATARAES